MSRTIEGITAAHAAATARRAAGQPIWDRSLDVSDVFHNDALTLTDKATAIAKRIRSTGWYDTSTSTARWGATIADVVEALEDGPVDVEEFDAIWDDVYDIADADRVWVTTCR